MSEMSNIVSVPVGKATDNDDVVVDDTEGGVILLSENLARKSALISNVGAYGMRVTTDGSIPTPTHGKVLISGATLSMSSPYCPTSEIKACPQGADFTSANASEVA